VAKYETVIGVDVGSYSVKAAWCSRRGRAPIVRRTEQLKLPRDPSQTAEMLNSWMEQVGLASQPCVISVRGSQAMFQPFTLAPDDPRTPEQAADMEVLKFNEMASETMAYGFASFSLTPEKESLLLAMARASVVREALRFAQESDLDVVDLVPSPVALFSAFESQMPQHDAPYMYVDIGQSYTEIAVGTGSRMMFARSFAGGGHMFTEALAGACGANDGQAENTKLGEGSLTQEGSETTDALRAGADAWLNELEACLSVYDSVFPDEEARIARVVLSGGGAKLKGLAEYVAAKLGIEAVSADALPGVKKKLKVNEFAVAIGLAMSGLEISPIPISLLPGNVRDELTFRRQKPFWIASAVTAALVFAVILVGGFRNIRRKETELRAQRVGLRRRQQLVAEIEGVREGIAYMRKLAVPVREILRSAPDMRNLITLVAEAKAEDDWVTMICDAESYFSTEPSDAAPAKPKPRTKNGRPTRRLHGTAKPKTEPLPGIQRVIIEGYTKTPDLSTVKQLIANLAATDVVASADLLSDDQLAAPVSSRPSRDATVSRFVIDCRLATQ